MGNDKRPLGSRPLRILLGIAVLAIIYWVGPQSDDVASNGDSGSQTSANPSSVDETTSSKSRDASVRRSQAEVSNPRTSASIQDPASTRDSAPPEITLSLDGVDLPGQSGESRSEPPRETDARPPPLRKSSAKPDTGSSQASTKTKTSQSDDGSGDLLYGLLREVSSRRYLSPAGLLYGPGSAEGHRLEHLRRHTKDDPGRRGSHGVFDGDMAGALATIDSAYERAKSGQRTTKEVDGDRTIYTVDLGKRIGYVGGSSGKRRGNPMARRVKLVVDGNYVVTAFPL